MNSVKMIHTIARYNTTPERMMNLFTKFTNQTFRLREHHLVHKPPAGAEEE